MVSYKYCSIHPIHDSWWSTNETSLIKDKKKEKGPKILGKIEAELFMNKNERLSIFYIFVVNHITWVPLSSIDKLSKYSRSSKNIDYVSQMY